MSHQATTRNPFRCFTGPFLFVALLDGLVVIALAFVARRYFPIGAPARLAIGVVQALLLGGLAVASVAAIRRLDELMYKVHLEAIAISFTVTGAVIAGWGMVEKAGAPGVDWAKWAWPMMTLLWGVAVMIRSRQYR